MTDSTKVLTSVSMDYGAASGLHVGFPPAAHPGSHQLSEPGSSLTHINSHNPMPLHPPARPRAPMGQHRIRALLIDHRHRLITELVVLLMNEVIPSNRHRRIPRARRHAEAPREIVHPVDHSRGRHQTDRNPLPPRHLTRAPNAETPLPRNS